jgi:hypothetical protein
MQTFRSPTVLNCSSSVSNSKGIASCPPLNCCAGAGGVGDSEVGKEMREDKGQIALTVVADQLSLGLHRLY